MGSHWAVVCSVAATAACSWATIPVATPHGSDVSVTCPSGVAPTLDSVGAATGLGVTALGVIGLAAEGGGPYTGFAVLALTPFAIGGIAYMFSARHGARERQRCQQYNEVGVGARTTKQQECERSRAASFATITTAEPQQRAAIVRELPGCGRATDPIEQAWLATRDGVLAALAMDCFEVRAIATRVRASSPVHYANVFSLQSDIAACLEQPADREACRAERARHQRAANRITDVDARARALRELPSCETLP